MWQIDIRHWQMGEFRRWHLARYSGDISEMNLMMSAAILQWPYEADPGNDWDYDTLSSEEWNRAVLQIEAAVQNRLHIGSPPHPEA